MAYILFMSNMLLFHKIKLLHKLWRLFSLLLVNKVAFNASILLAGHQEEHLASKNWVMGAGGRLTQAVLEKRLLNECSSSSSSSTFKQNYELQSQGVVLTCSRRQLTSVKLVLAVGTTFCWNNATHTTTIISFKSRFLDNNCEPRQCWHKCSNMWK